MARTIMDDGLRSWEAFANPGAFGYAERAQVVFQCTSDPGERPRACSLDGDKAHAESRVAQAAPAELAEMLARAKPLD